LHAAGSVSSDNMTCAHMMTVVAHVAALYHKQKTWSIIVTLLTLCCEWRVRFIIIPIVLALLYACVISCLSQVAMEEKLPQFVRN